MLYSATTEQGSCSFLHDSCNFFDSLCKHDLSSWTVMTRSTQKVRDSPRVVGKMNLHFLSQPFLPNSIFDPSDVVFREANLAKLHGDKKARKQGSNSGIFNQSGEAPSRANL